MEEIAILIVFAVGLSIAGGFMAAVIVNPQEHISDEICFAHVTNVSCIEKCATYNIWYGITKNYCWFERTDK